MKPQPKKAKARFVEENFLRGLPLFQGIPRTSRAFQRFLGEIRLKSYKKGSLIYKPGTKGHNFYIIRSGEVHIIHGSGLSARIIAIGNSGDVFGESSYFSHEAHAATAQASLDSSIYTIDGNTFLKLLTLEPSVAEEFTLILSKRLRHRTIQYTDVPSMIYTLAYPENPRSGNRFSGMLGHELILQKKKPTALVSFSRYHHDRVLQLEDFLYESTYKKLESLNKNSSNGKKTIIFHSPLENMKSERIEKAVPQFLGYLKRYFSYILIDISEDPSSPALRQFLKQSDLLILIRSMNNPQRASEQWIRTAKKCKINMPGFSDGLITVTHESLPVMKPSVSLNLAREERLILGCNEAKLNVNQFRIVTKNEDGPWDDDKITHSSIARLGRRLTGTSRGICFGGGGARSFSQAGVMDVLEKEHIEFDAISGTSMGAIIGAGFAMGLNSREVRYFIKQYLPDSKAILDQNLPVVSFFRGRKLTALLDRIFEDLVFDDLEMPLFCNGSDLNTGRLILFNHGKISRALRATSSIPGIFPPFETGHFSIVDGGVLNNMPGDILREMGFQKILGVNVTPRIDRFSGRTAIRSETGMFGIFKGIQNYFSIPPILKIITRSIALQGRELMYQNLEHFDLVIHPDISRYQMFDFHLYDEIIRKGRLAAKDELKEIKKVLS